MGQWIDVFVFDGPKDLTYIRQAVADRDQGYGLGTKALLQAGLCNALGGQLWCPLLSCTSMPFLWTAVPE